MNYYLAGQESKKVQLVKVLNQYARDRSVDQLGQNLNMILQTPVQRRLLREIRFVNSFGNFSLQLCYNKLQAQKAFSSGFVDVLRILHW